MSVIDLCAGGAGGWEYAARELGLDPLGIELDDAACAVRRAAGFRTLQADISALDPLDFAPCAGLVGGVPCPSFSMAGKGVGRAAIPFFVEAIERMARGESIDRDELDANCKDPTGHLVLEPLRWALALRPRWIAQEQVEPVLPIWRAMTKALRAHGYSAWCGVVSAETFGTPQTRRRAILLASLDGPVSAPVATHQRYVAPNRKRREALNEAHGGGMLDVPAERIVHREDRGLLPWVSMAQALGWGMTARSTHTITAGGTGGGGGVEVFASDDVRQIVERERAAGRWSQRSNYSDGSSGTGTAEERGRTERSVDEPSLAVTSKGFQWKREEDDDGRGTAGRDVPALLRGDLPASPDLQRDDAGQHAGPGPLSEVRDEGGPDGGSASERSGIRFVANAQPNAAVRDVDEPAPTITAGHDSGERVWLRAGTNEHDTSRSQDEPAPTIRFGQRLNNVSWVHDRPTPTIVSTRRSDEGLIVGRQLPPGGGRNVGGHGWTGERPATTVDTDTRVFGPHSSSAGESQSQNAVRVSIEEAAVLQGFPPDHPWMAAGSKTAAYRCVGNAIPPQMALASLLAVRAGAARQDEAA